MGNALTAEIKGNKKRHKIMTKKTYPKGIVLYFLKRTGRTQSFDVLAKFDFFGVDFDKFRHTEFIEVAVGLDEVITWNGESRPITLIAKTATHIAQVLPSGENRVYAIRNGDEWLPMWINAIYTFYVKQVSDNFVLAENP